MTWQEIGVEFDNWFSERTLFQSGEYDEALDVLRQKDYLSERDNATWFDSTLLGDDKDNVVVRSSGEPTYFASDIAYHYNKFIKRGYETVVDIWAPTIKATSPDEVSGPGTGDRTQPPHRANAQMVSLRRGRSGSAELQADRRIRYG